MSLFIVGVYAVGFGDFIMINGVLEFSAFYYNKVYILTKDEDILHLCIFHLIMILAAGFFVDCCNSCLLIARYLVRDRVLKLAEGNKKFLAIDKAIGENSFRVVALLRLSPLLPFSLGNYLYGLTSVKIVPYVLGR